MLIIKQIPEAPDYYITSDGEVWSLRWNNTSKERWSKSGQVRPSEAKNTLIILGPSKDEEQNRSFVRLTRPDGKMLSKSIRRLVAEAFLPNPLGAQKARRKSESVGNVLDNLEWIVKKEKVGTKPAYVEPVIKPASLSVDEQRRFKLWNDFGR